MKAWVLRRQAPIGENPLELVELPVPEPGPGQVLLRVLVCGICRTDLHIAEGDLPMRRPDLILGHEIVGVVEARGAGVSEPAVGELVGVTWLGSSCGTCRFCRSGRENYCPEFRATGWDLQGGFAEFTLAEATSTFPLAGIPLPEEELAPLMCPGVASHCAFRLTDAEAGQRLGLYGFGPTADYNIRVARHLGIEVFVSSRSPKNLERALERGAAWAGDAARDGMPSPLDAAIVFPPAGPLVERALSDLVVGGTLVLAPVAMSTIEIRDYSSHLWGRDIRTLYNVNRRDNAEFLGLAREIDLALGVEVVPFEELPAAMLRVRQGQLSQPNAVVRVAGR